MATAQKTVLITDFDGTLYDPSIRIFLSPYFGRLTSEMLRKHNIHFVVNTGRTSWTGFDEFQLRLLGYHAPEMVVYGSGTRILKRTKSGSLKKDENWQKIISNTKITWTKSDSPVQWDYTDISKSIAETLRHWNLSIQDVQNPHVIAVSVSALPVRHVHNCMDALKKLWKRGIKIILSEKLYLPNSLSTFNGYMYIVPEAAGKDCSSEYILKKYFTESSRPNALFIGDALIDVPMLAMDVSKLTKKSYSYGVHMTPLALENLKIADPQSKIMHTPGSAPKAFLRVIKAYVSGHPIEAQQHAKIVEPA